VSVHKWSFCPISVSYSKNNPWNIYHMPAVIFFACLDLEQKLSYMHGHRIAKAMTPCRTPLFHYSSITTCPLARRSYPQVWERRWRPVVGKRIKLFQFHVHFSRQQQSSCIACWSFEGSFGILPCQRGVWPLIH
jgi:hypothetical protein